MHKLQVSSEDISIGHEKRILDLTLYIIGKERKGKERKGKERKGKERRVEQRRREEWKQEERTGRVCSEVISYWIISVMKSVRCVPGGHVCLVSGDLVVFLRIYDD